MDGGGVTHISETRKVEIVLVTAPKECPKCIECEAIVARLEERYPGRIEFRKVNADAPEAADLGVVMPPMLIVGDLLVCAGRVPVESSLANLIELQLQEGTGR